MNLDPYRSEGKPPGDGLLDWLALYEDTIMKFQIRVIKVGDALCTVKVGCMKLKVYVPFANLKEGQTFEATATVAANELRFADWKRLGWPNDEMTGDRHSAVPSVQFGPALNHLFSIENGRPFYVTTDGYESI